MPHKYGEGYHVVPIIWMKTRDDAIVPWLCSQTDALADDWMLVGAHVMPKQLEEQ